MGRPGANASFQAARSRRFFFQIKPPAVNLWMSAKRVKTGGNLIVIQCQTAISGLN
jgi:hypothetical protein